MSLRIAEVPKFSEGNVVSDIPNSLFRVSGVVPLVSVAGNIGGAFSMLASTLSNCLAMSSIKKFCFAINESGRPLVSSMLFSRASNIGSSSGA
jgi:hypothetical protein